MGEMAIVVGDRKELTYLLSLLRSADVSLAWCLDPVPDVRERMRAW